MKTVYIPIESTSRRTLLLIFSPSLFFFSLPLFLSGSISFIVSLSSFGCCLFLFFSLQNEENTWRRLELCFLFNETVMTWCGGGERPQSRQTWKPFTNVARAQANSGWLDKTKLNKQHCGRNGRYFGRIQEIFLLLCCRFIIIIQRSPLRGTSKGGKRDPYTGRLRLVSDNNQEPQSHATFHPTMPVLHAVREILNMFVAFPFAIARRTSGQVIEMRKTWDENLILILTFN